MREVSSFSLPLWVFSEKIRMTIRVSSYIYFKIEFHRFLVLFFYGKNLHLFIAKKEEREGRTVEAEKGRTME